MKNNRLRIAVVVSTLFGLVAAYGVFDFLRSQRRAVESMKLATSQVVVAADAIPAGSAIEPKQIRVVQYPKDAVPAGAFTDPATLVGRSTAGPFVAGEPILASRLAEGGGALLTARLEPGFRAMAIKVNEVIGVSGFIAPNDRVDVIANLENPDADGADKELAKLVLQDKRVLSVAQTVEGSKDGKPNVARSITLEVSPDEAERLSFATSRGEVMLALRAANDRETTETKGSTVADFLPAKPRARAARQAYAVRVYNGSEQSVVTF